MTTYQSFAVLDATTGTHTFTRTYRGFLQVDATNGLRLLPARTYQAWIPPPGAVAAIRTSLGGKVPMTGQLWPRGQRP
jgi:hypothetical protein